MKEEIEGFGFCPSNRTVRFRGTIGRKRTGASKHRRNEKEGHENSEMNSDPYTPLSQGGDLDKRRSHRHAEQRKNRPIGTTDLSKGRKQEKEKCRA